MTKTVTFICDLCSKPIEDEKRVCEFRVDVPPDVAGYPRHTGGHAHKECLEKLGILKPFLNLEAINWLGQSAQEAQALDETLAGEAEAREDGIQNQGGD